MLTVEVNRLTVRARSKTRYQTLSEGDLPWALDLAVPLFHGPIWGAQTEVYYNEFCGVVVILEDEHRRDLRLYANIDEFVVDCFGGWENWPTDLQPIQPIVQIHDIVARWQKFIGS